MSDPTLPLLLTRLGRLNESFLQQACARASTTPSELRVLAMLAHHIGDAPVAPTTIAEWIVQSSGGLTATLKRLEHAGWITRHPDPTDGRASQVELTGAGKVFHDELMAQIMDRYELVFQGVDDRVALGVIRDLVDGFERVAGQPRSRGWAAEESKERA
jgi:DNA-binding MarR family transcriptional regulator